MALWVQFGLFHGDPHPGNIFALEDGRIAYVDFGNVAEVSQQNKQTLIDAVVHAVNEDYEEMAKDFIKLVRFVLFHPCWQCTQASVEGPLVFRADVGVHCACLAVCESLTALSFPIWLTLRHERGWHFLCKASRLDCTHS